MTIEEIKKKIAGEEYDFLRRDKHLGNRIILLGLGGSYSYGSNVETSDLDGRGVALNSKTEILTNERFEQFEKFFEMVDALDKRLEYDKENTSLPERPNYDKINEFVMSVNERVVKDEI